MLPRGYRFLTLLTLIVILVTACSSQPFPSDQPDETAASIASEATEEAAIATQTPLATVTATSIPTTTTHVDEVPLPTPALPVFYEPAGCKTPPDASGKVNVNGFIVNARTYEMLKYAAELYGGEIDITGSAITQGSYSNNGPASFGTHLGGGAVDISVYRENSYTILYEDIERLIRALRTAGFAAWLRDWNELAEGSGIHIHAIAIGDPELSEAAEEQLTGAAGYFRGYAGYTNSDGEPATDRFRGPLVCQWMVEAGYTDLRPESERTFQPPEKNWLIKLQETAESYLTTSETESIQVARDLDYLESNSEDPSLMCGPLAAALLKAGGVLPVGEGPWQDLHVYWLADPDIDGKPFSLFPNQDYELFRYKTPLSEFDFSAWPLRPGDFLYTYANGNGFEHMFVVIEVDDQGRAYTVANQYRGSGVYLIEKLLLYDPGNPGKGVIYEEWRDPVLGRTGHDGFDVLRIRGLSQEPGSLYEYQVRAGDTAITVANKFYSTPEAIAEANPSKDTSHLELGGWIWVPVNLTGYPEPIDAQAPVEDTSGDLNRHINELIGRFPSGSWSVYIEDLETGETVTIEAERAIHPASTIKLAIALALMTYFERHPEASLTDAPPPYTRSFEQLLEAMLIKSEEEAAGILQDFLEETVDARPQALVEEWGAVHTSIEPRRSTAADLGLLWKRFYRGELLDADSTAMLLEVLRRPSSGDDERIGAGVPEDIRLMLAHKTGTTFEAGLGAVADSGVVETPDGAYVIVVLGNSVNWVDFEAAKVLIAEISRAAWDEFGGE